MSCLVQWTKLTLALTGNLFTKAHGRFSASSSLPSVFLTEIIRRSSAPGGLALYQRGQKQPVAMCKTEDMNQAIRSKREIRQDFAETTFDHLRAEMERSPVTRSAREGLKPCLSDPDCPGGQTSLRIEDEREPKSKAITPNAKAAARRQARWLFHYEQEHDKPAQRENPIGLKCTNGRRGE
jgi:hypothetical protein